MFAKPFNPKRPFGDVHGIPGVAYDQDGQLFNPQKQPVDINGKPMTLAPADAAPAAAPAPEAPKPAAPSVIAEDDDTLEEDKLDLRAWAKDDPDLYATPWQTVRAAAAGVLDDITELKSKAALKAALLAHFGEA